MGSWVTAISTVAKPPNHTSICLAVAIMRPTALSRDGRRNGEFIVLSEELMEPGNELGLSLTGGGITDPDSGSIFGSGDVPGVVGNWIGVAGIAGGTTGGVGCGEGSGAGVGAGGRTALGSWNSGQS